MRPRDHDRHKLGTANWLRASVLGANDGIVSTSSLLLGLAAAHAPHATLLLSGTAALVLRPEALASAEALVELLHYAWRQTEMVRVRLVRLQAPQPLSLI